MAVPDCTVLYIHHFKVGHDGLVARGTHRNIQKMSLEKGVTCFIWFMYLDGKNEQNVLFLKMIQIRTNNTRSQSIADPRESGGAAK